MNKFSKVNLYEGMIYIVVFLCFFILYTFVNYTVIENIKDKLYKASVFIENEFIPHMEFNDPNYIIKTFKNDMFHLLEIEVKRYKRYEVIYRSKKLNKNDFPKTHDNLDYKFIKVLNKNVYPESLLLTKHVVLNSHDYVIRVAFSLERYNKIKKISTLAMSLLYLLSVFFIFYFIKKLKKSFKSSLCKIEDAVKMLNKGKYNQIIESNDMELCNDLYIEINSLIENFKNISEKINYMTSNISHELNTPMTIMRGEIEVTLMKERSVDRYKSTMVSILEEVLTLQASIDNLLLLGQLSNKNIDLNMSSIKMNKIIDGVLEINKVQINDKKISINRNNSLAIVFGEFILLKHMISNIINNAIKYSSECSNIYINVKQNKSNIKLVIIDEGQGIDERSIDSIFNPFFRSQHHTDDFPEGMGIGLYLVKKIADLHHIGINVTSKLNHGTKFELIFQQEGSYNVA